MTQLAWRVWGVLFLGYASWSANAGVFTNQAEDDEALNQQRLAVLVELRAAKRVNEVMFRLGTAGVSLCEGETAANPGFVVVARDSFAAAMRDGSKALGYDLQARVAYVASSSAAAQAGLQAGDVILAVGSTRFDEATDVHAEVTRALRRIEPGKIVSLTLQHSDGVIDTLEFTMQAACNYTPRVLRSHVINAASTGWDIYITTGMVDFLESDTELAAMLAHEMAHSAMSHVARKLGNTMLGKLVDTLLTASTGPAGSLLVSTFKPAQTVGGLAYSQAFEREADYVAMYLLALAGYDLNDSPRLWRKLAVEFPDAHERSYFGTHPATPERILLQKLTAEEIAAKKAVSAVLRPELERRVSTLKAAE